MIVEQIRYFTAESDREQVLLVRREVSHARERLGLPPGQIFVADPEAENSPVLIWQCAYADEAEMARATEELMGDADYEAARKNLAGLAVNVELELFIADEESLIP